ncbi:MAG: TerD family protein [Nocardioides sp.]
MEQLTQGQTLTVRATRIRVGLGWDKVRTAGALSGIPDVDLDASAVQFADGELFDLAFYNNLRTRDGSVEHLGDNQTGRGEGDDETIAVDLAKVYEKVDTIFLLVSSYQGHSLEWIHNAYCRIVDEDDAEIARVTLTGGVSETGVVLAKLVRGTDGWSVHALAEGIAVTLPTESPARLKRFL